MFGSSKRFKLLALLATLGGALAIFVIACGGGEAETVTEIQTVVVERQVTQIEKVIETVVVEKMVEGKTVKVVETVVVEKPVTRTEKVIETVVVEKSVTRTEKVVETVVVEKIVEGKTVTEIQTVVVEKVVVATAAPSGPSGSLVVAETRIIPAVYLPSKQGGGVEFNYIDWGVMEYLVRAAPHGSGDLPDPAEAVHGIAVSWEADPAGEKVTYTLREGVPFHEGWGDVTAADVAFSFNEGNRTGTRFYRNSTSQTDRWEALDDRTVVIYYKPGEFNPRFIESHWNAGGGNTPIISKKLVDELGEDKALPMMIGTGPYVSKNWVADDEVDLEAFPDYWRADGQPKTKNIKIVAIAEEAVKIAAMRTGEVDIGAISSKFLTQALSDITGSIAYPVGRAQMQVLFFGGNYWAQHWPEENEDVFPREGLKADAEHPWIGDPRDPASMESSQKVREALAIAIDRDLINEQILAGLGGPQFIYWGAVGLDSPFFKESWRIPYDPERAKALLAEAGVAPGTTIPIWIPPDNPAVDSEVGQGVAQMWRDIGLNTAIETTAYAARRPTLVSRSMDIPWMHHGGVGGEPDGSNFGSMRPTGGFSHALETPDGNFGLPDIQSLYFANRTEPDFIKRVQNNQMIMDWAREVMWLSPVVRAQAHYVAGPRVKEWRPHSFAWKDFLSPETVVVE